MQIYPILYQPKYDTKSPFEGYKELKHSAEVTNINSQGAFRFHGDKKWATKANRQKANGQKRDKTTIQRNSACQHKAMTYDVISYKRKVLLILIYL